MGVPRGTYTAAVHTKTHILAIRPQIVKEKGYLPSHCIVMQVNNCLSVVYFFQPVGEGLALLFSKGNKIATLVPSNTTSIRAWAPWGTATSGYFILCALMRDFVGDSGSADGLDKCYLSSSCKKAIKSKGTTVYIFRRKLSVN